MKHLLKTECFSPAFVCACACVCMHVCDTCVCIYMCICMLFCARFWLCATVQHAWEAAKLGSPQLLSVTAPLCSPRTMNCVTFEQTNVMCRGASQMSTGSSSMRTYIMIPAHRAAGCACVCVSTHRFLGKEVSVCFPFSTYTFPYTRKPAVHC